MAFTALKPVTVTILNQKHLRKDWFFDFDGQEFKLCFENLANEMEKLGVKLHLLRNREVEICINSYADLLNALKISSPEAGHTNQCIGHIIGKSEHLDILEDLKIAVKRIAFAPETIAPANEFRKVCHNCGCGC
ncbi:hypothetical protein [Pelotalea chapellei]|uniref:Uncharacterized protein n=1 Tax=Pelotalea chapellei TaxID=44671 RepID=A0ABS5U7Z0_9BACT|nr:hypothetical protein [Pelotalea chapellei]MBT1071764.1 hypothetical protein [Pelotalea chapellei]